MCFVYLIKFVLFVSVFNSRMRNLCYKRPETSKAIVGKEVEILVQSLHINHQIYTYTSHSIYTIDI